MTGVTEKCFICGEKKELYAFIDDIDDSCCEECFEYVVSQKIGNIHMKNMQGGCELC